MKEWVSDCMGEEHYGGKEEEKEWKFKTELQGLREREIVPAPAPSVWPRLCRASLRPPLPGTPAAQRTPLPGASPSLPSHSAPDWTTQHMTRPHEPQKHSSFYTTCTYTTCTYTTCTSFYTTCTYTTCTCTCTSFYTTCTLIVEHKAK